MMHLPAPRPRSTKPAVSTYTLTAAEAAIYDACHGPDAVALYREIVGRYDGQDIDVYHPEGFCWLTLRTNDRA